MINDIVCTSMKVEENLFEGGDMISWDKPTKILLQIF